MANEEDPLLYDDDENFDREQSQDKMSLADVWANNPSLKLFAIVAVVGIAIIGFLMFGGSDKPDISRVASVNTITEAPGQGELPPAYEDAVRQADERAAEQATTQGGSSFPTPIARPSERIEAPTETEEEDPLSQWRREAERRREERARNRPELPEVAEPAELPSEPAPRPRITPEQRQAQMLQQLPSEPNSDQVSALSDSFRTQMQAILQSKVPQESILVNMGIQPAYQIPTPEAQMADASSTSQPNTPNNFAGINEQPEPEMMISAGTIAYAQVLTQANSDIPGPVLIHIASGPLAGARALGQFQVTDEYLVLRFDKAVLDNKEYAINALAIDPSTTQTAVATDVNRHYFTRVFLPAAAEFLTGFSEAVVRQGTQVTINDEVVTTSQDDLNTEEEILAGLDEGANRFAQILDRSSRRDITVKVEKGTRIGLLFLDSLYQNE